MIAPATHDTGLPSLTRPAHALTCDEVVGGLRSDGLNGLSAADAKQRLCHGKNQIDDGPRVQPVKILIRQFANAMVLVLVLAMVVSFAAVSSWIEGGVVALVILLNVVVGFHQEYNAEKTMASLQSLSSPTASVVRDGSSVVLPAPDVVLGDIVELKVGDTVPADLRLLESMNLETDEALLTGESLPVAKDSTLKFENDTGPGDRLNVAYASSSVTKGRGRGVVIATGMSTEIGTVAAALRNKDSKVRSVKRRADGTAHPLRHVQSWYLTFTDAIGRFLGINVGTPLQKTLSRLALLLFALAVVCAIIVLASNNFNDKPETIIYAVSSGLSLLPASLQIILTVTMAMGTKNMVQRHVIVRNMQALEALGAVTDICSDKTGTLTQGRMVAKACWGPAFGTYKIGPSENSIDPTIGELSYNKDPPADQSDDNDVVMNYRNAANDNLDLKEFLFVSSLANLAHVHRSGTGEWHARGDPTEIALQVFASRFGFNRSDLVEGEHPEYHLTDEFPFDSSVKKMSVIMNDKKTGEHTIYTKGAVERVLESCSHFRRATGHETETVELDEEEIREIYQVVEVLASQGLRVLALASAPVMISKFENTELTREAVEQSLIFRGLVGLYDPPRPESAMAVQRCRQAGIQVRMLTGDHVETARAIAKQVTILPDMDMASAPVAKSMVMTAKEFDAYSDDELDALETLPLVIARCSPFSKVRMIEALRRRKAFMGMTGDGVNDSPSLKIADVGIAMGQTGSDVAKDASDLVLTDDNFASIVNAIEEGRRTFDNIQKFILHLLAQNIAQAFTLLIGLAFKDSTNLSVFPLSPVQIMFVIMITSSMPDMGLGLEAAAPDILQRPPHNLKQGVFTMEVMFDMLAYGLWMSALCLGSFLLVMFGFGDGSFGDDCNAQYSPACDTVFRARATTFVSLTWFSLFLAWELVDMRRSFFFVQPGDKPYFTRWLHSISRNKVLFWAIIAGFVFVFPTLYIPVLNDKVFKHKGITWEWGVVFVAAILFFAGVEAWKWGKRMFFRRTSARVGDALEEQGLSRCDTIGTNVSSQGKDN
ncbi:sodium transport ATPase [Myriangium duriaei CBS 260.36]|uniref:P-type Na(+) transporter n=1 Tax=Myriangium duriaei CBS 260.36 TaxID=1168546 RepID=A0A9P4IXK0_9PEZI|nr:sodium transport ATPase [Myriangium duriaei CBS 260.36]